MATEEKDTKINNEEEEEEEEEEKEENKEENKEEDKEEKKEEEEEEEEEEEKIEEKKEEVKEEEINKEPYIKEEEKKEEPKIEEKKEESKIEEIKEEPKIEIKKKEPKIEEKKEEPITKIEEPIKKIEEPIIKKEESILKKEEQKTILTKDISSSFNDQLVSNEEIDINPSELPDDSNVPEVNQLNMNDISDDFIPSQIFDLYLEDNGYPKIKKEEIYSTNVETQINIKIKSNSLLGKEIKLISNSYNEFPNINFINEFKCFIRENPYEQKIENKDIDINKLKAYMIQPFQIENILNFKVNFKKSGIFIFMILYRNKDTRKYQLTKPFYILVNPIIDLGKEENTDSLIKIALNKIQLQSVLSKNLGKLSKFEYYYNELSLLKYNFIHFTSIQQLSSCDNLYCLKDQNEISNSFFEENEKLSNEQKLNKFKENMTLLKTKYHIGSVIDIILNQTSIESDWIIDHPECCYTLDNCPWLTIAYELDKLLVNYSNLFFERKVGCESAPYLNNETDLNNAIEEMRTRILRENLEEYCLIPIEEYLTKFQEFYQNLDKDQSFIDKRNLLLKDLENIFNIKTNASGRLMLNDATIYDLFSYYCSNYGESRFGIKINIELVSMLLLENYRDNNTNSYQNEFNFLKEAKKFINKINDYWINKVSEMLKIALLNVKEFIRYEFIELKRTGIRRKLIDNYFHVVDPNDKKKIFLCNGFIMQSEDPSNNFPDFTKENTWYLFKRKVIIWNDTIKLNYGEDIKQTPKYLIQHMNKYINNMSKIFNGLYFDNIITLPKFIVKYFINEARKTNENIFIIAQLPENNNEKEVEYINECGINLFSKEMIWCTNPSEIISNINQFTKIKYNSQNNTQINILLPQNPPTLLYDLSLDNQSYYEQFNNLSLNLSMMACIGLLNCAIGSTRGYDQLFPCQPSLVQENRKYIYDTKFEFLLLEIKKKLQQEKQVKEIFFEFHPRNSENPNTKHVRLALSSHGWKPDIPLTKINDNLFTVRLRLTPGKYHYRYLLDGNIWTYDSSQPMEFDANKRIINVIDLCIDTKILSNDIKLLRRDINIIRDKLKNSKSEVYIQNDKDLICVLRMINDSKKVKVSIDAPSSRRTSFDAGDRDYNRNIDNFYSMDQLALAENAYKNQKNQMRPNYHNQDNNFNDISSSNPNFNIRSTNFNKPNYKPEFIDSIIYEGYAIICRPGYDINDNKSINGKIIIPGEITDFICGCYMNIGDFDINDFYADDELKGVVGNVYYSKDANFLSSISNVIFQGGNTIIDFHSILPNTVIILKISSSGNNLNSYN